jgi:hypothetical protein
LASFGYGFAPTIRTSDVPNPPPAVATIRSLDRTGEWFIAGRLDAFPSNLATEYLLRDVASYDVLTSEAETQKLVSAGYDPFFHGFVSDPSREQLRILGEMGVRFWIGSEVEEIPNARKPRAALRSAPPGIGAGLAVTALGGILLLSLLLSSPPDNSHVLNNTS